MDILLLLMIAAILAPVLHVAGIVLGNSEIRSRGKKVLKAQYMTKREPKKSLAPSVIPAEYTGKIELKDKQRDKDKKLQGLWQDAYDWFAIQNVAEVVEKGRALVEAREAALKPYKDDIQFYENMQASGHDYHHYWQLEFQCRDQLEEAQKEYPDLRTPEHKRAMEIADKYGWELMDNGIIRNINKGTLLAVDPIVYAL